jgi:hypothetical protein
LCRYKTNHMAPAAKKASVLGFFFASIVDSRLLFVADATAVKSTAVARVPRRCGIAASGRPVAATRRANAGGKCMPIEAADIAPEAAA